MSIVKSDLFFNIHVGGWASIYIDFPLRAMDPKSLLLLLMTTKLVDPLRAMELLGSLFTDNASIYYGRLCILIHTYLW